MPTADAHLEDRPTAVDRVGVGVPADTGPRDTGPRDTGPRDTGPRRLLVPVAAGLLLALALTALAFHLTGGRWQSVSTPSMGTAAPVGTLVLTRPVSLDELRVGDVITYHPPPEPAVTYTHRVVELGPAGARTRGDINGAVDPWTVGQADLVGRVVARWWGIGFLARALPVLLLGGLVVWAATRWLLPPWLRGPVRLVGAALLVLLVAALMRPFAAAVQLTTTADEGITRVSMVSTGLLPIRLSVPNATADPLDLRAGQTGVLSITGQPPDGRAQIDLGLHMSLPWWTAVVLFWLSPLLGVLLLGLRTVPVDDEAPGDAA